MSKKVVVMKRTPSYAKYLSEPFRIRKGDKFIVTEELPQYFVLVSVRLKKKMVFLKTYFKDEVRKEVRTKIQYD